MQFEWSIGKAIEQRCLSPPEMVACAFLIGAVYAKVDNQELVLTLSELSLNSKEDVMEKTLDCRSAGGGNNIKNLDAASCALKEIRRCNIPIGKDSSTYATSTSKSSSISHTLQTPLSTIFTVIPTFGEKFVAVFCHAFREVHFVDVSGTHICRAPVPSLTPTSSISYISPSLFAIFGGNDYPHGVEFFEVKNNHVKSFCNTTLLEKRYLTAAVALPKCNHVLVIGGSSICGTKSLRDVELITIYPSEESARSWKISQTFDGNHENSTNNFCRLCSTEPNLFIHSINPTKDNQLLHTENIISKKKRKSLIQARASCGAVMLPNSQWILVVGGDTRRQSLATTELYNIETDKWIPGPLLKVARSNPSVYVISTGTTPTVIVAGGYDFESQMTVTSIEMWNYSNVTKIPLFSNNTSHGIAPLLNESFCLLHIAIPQPINSSIMQLFALQEGSGNGVNDEDEYILLTGLSSMQTSVESNEDTSVDSIDLNSQSTCSSLLEAPKYGIKKYFDSKFVEKLRRRKFLF